MIDHRGAYPLLLAAFAVLGANAGVWQVLLGDMARSLGLASGPLGAVLVVGSLGSLPVMYLGGRLVDARGAGPVVVGGAAFIAIAFLGHAVALSAWTFALALLLYGMGVGFYDVGINGAAAVYEQVSGRRVMAFLHAAFSGGAMVGALSSGALLAAGVGFRTQYLGCMALAAVLGLVTWRARVLPTPPPREVQTVEGGMFRHRAVLVLAFIAAAGYFGENGMEAWSAIYLRQDLGVPVFIGASGVAVFHSAMVFGRLTMGAAIARVGRRNWLIGAGALGIAGTLLATGVAQAGWAIGGLLLLGVALSAIAPLAFSLAGEVAPRRAGEASAVITTIAYCGALASPGVIGWVAQWTSLRAALALVALASLQIFVLAWRVPRR